MIDLHQGMTGEELRDVKPGVGDIAMSQLDVWSALLRGNLKGAARKQAHVWAIVGRSLLASARSAVKRRS